MRKLLVVLLIGWLLSSALPQVAFAGDPHAVRNRWNGVAIGAAVLTLGGLLVSALQAPPPPVVAAPTPPAPPVVYTPPPADYTPPPVVYTPPPVVYAAPQVVYVPAPVAVYPPPPVWAHRGWGPPAYRYPHHH
jgi:hypothetical protein